MLSLISSVAVGLLCLNSVFAAPSPILTKKDINSDLLSELNLMEQYAAAAYCATNQDSVGTEVACPLGNACPRVDEASTRTEAEFQNSLLTDVTGFVAADNTNKRIVVSFRGSQSIRNWITNFSFDVTPTDLCAGCTVHRGFWLSWLEARRGVLAAIEKARAANPSYSVAVVGHSLGGAIATLAAANLRNNGVPTALYTFGAPRIAGAKLSDYISAQAGGNFRVTHYNDPVPRLPPIAFGFVHVSPEYYIEVPNKAAVRPQDVEVLYGNFNKNGNSAWFAQDVEAHRWYLADISACAPGGFEWKAV